MTTPGELEAQLGAPKDVRGFAIALAREAGAIARPAFGADVLAEPEGERGDAGRRRWTGRCSPPAGSVLSQRAGGPRRRLLLAREAGAAVAPFAGGAEVVAAAPEAVAGLVGADGVPLASRGGASRFADSGIEEGVRLARWRSDRAFASRT